MLYDTTYYANVKPRRRVRCLPTAGRGGCHPQAASSDWRAILVDGDGRMVGETRPRVSVGSICPATKNAPPCGRAERLRKVIACRQNYPGQRIAYCAHFVARRSFLPGNRQVSRKALLQRAARPNFFPSRRNTLSQTLPSFRDTVPAVAAAYAALRGLRSYRQRSNPTHRSPPLSFVHHGATRCGRRGGSPFRLQLLRSVAPLSPHFPSLPAFLGFPPPDVP